MIKCGFFVPPNSSSSSADCQGGGAFATGMALLFCSPRREAPGRSPLFLAGAPPGPRQPSPLVPV